MFCQIWGGLGQILSSGAIQTNTGGLLISTISSLGKVCEPLRYCAAEERVNFFNDIVNFL